jgi:hypothetical protein
VSESIRNFLKQYTYTHTLHDTYNPQFSLTSISAVIVLRNPSSFTLTSPPSKAAVNILTRRRHLLTAHIPLTRIGLHCLSISEMATLEPYDLCALRFTESECWEERL